jgi:hypothetical protein
VEITPFKMLNSKRLKFTLAGKFIKFSKPEQKFPLKNKLMKEDTPRPSVLNGAAT